MKEKLLVSVIGGKNLKKKKTWILLKLKLHNAKYRTKYVYGGENVEFQKETFIFEVNEDVYPAGDLEIKVKTWEMFKKGEVFACATVPLPPITSEIRTIGSSGITEIKSFTLSDSTNSTTSGNGTGALSLSTSSTSSLTSSVTSSASVGGQVHGPSVQKRFSLKSKKGEDTNSELTITFELVPEVESTTMKSIPLLFRWFPDLPHSETVISECYCTKEAKKTISISHNGTMYITQNYLCFRSPSHLAKNKKTMIHFKDITRIKKKIGSFYLPNAIEVRTSKKKYLFASFIHRSKAYSILINQWNLHGGSERHSNSIAGSGAEDDDDDQDGDDDDDDEDDEEVSSINSSGSDTKISLIANARSLSPLVKLTDSGGSQKKRSLSIGAKSPSKPSTPTPITESKSNSSGNLNPNQIKLIIEIEDFEQFGSNNHLMINVTKENTVLELLEKLKLKLSSSSDDKFISSYILAILKKKSKIKKNKRGSGVYLPIDQLMMINEPLEDDIVSYETLLHRAKSTGGNAMTERKFIILEKHKQLSTYSFDSQDVIYLKKPRYIEDVNLSFEIVDEKSKVIKLILNIETPISEIFRELSKYSSKKIFSADYYLYLPKNGERGIVLDPSKTLNDYRITSNSTIQVNRYPPFEGFSQKFKLTSTRNKRSLLFELIQSCLTHSIPTTQMQLMDRPQEFLNRLQHKLQLDDTDAKIITANVLSINQYKDEGLLVELKSHCEELKRELDPYYSVEAFAGNMESYHMWKRFELNHLVHLMRNVIFKEDCFYGVLFVRLIEAEQLSSMPINQYCIFSTSHHRVKSTTELNTTTPNWDQQFILKLQKPKGKLEVAVMSSTSANDTLLGKIEINIKDLEDTAGHPKDMWFSLPTNGRIHLSLEYQYQFSEYNQYISHHLNRLIDESYSIDNNTDDNDDDEEGEVKSSHSHSDQNEEQQTGFDLSKYIPVDHVALYKILFNFIMDERERILNEEDSPLKEDDAEWILISHRSLLNQYSIRFGVCKTSSNIIQLETMVDKYTIEKSFNLELEEVTTTLLDIINGKEDGVFTTNELQSLKQSLDKLLPKVKYHIGRYYECFPGNKPRGSLKSLVKSYENILQIKGILEKKTYNFHQILSQSIQEESKRKFDENIASLGFQTLEYDQKVRQVDTITNMLIEIMNIITEEIDQTIHFESAFPMEVKITCDVIDAWGTCIVSVIEEFCNWAPYSPNILTLVKKLLDYFNFTKKITGDRFRPLPLKQLFITYVYKLLKEIKVQLNAKVIDATSKDDKKSVSITQGVSSSYIQFFEACDNAIKDFSSLLWLPDSFSYVQLLEVISSEVINYSRIIADHYQEYIAHTEIEESGKPTWFTLNVEPVVMLNNMDSAKTRLDQYGAKIEKDLNKYLSSSQASNMDDYSKQCVVSSFKMCFEESQSIVAEFYNKSIAFLCDRIKNNVFYLFQEVLFTEPLILLNSHITEEEDEDTSVVTTQNNNAATVLFEPVHDTAILLNNASSVSSSGSQPLNIKNSANSNSKEYLKYEKAILTPVKEFLSPKIEELYGKLKESLFKQFIKKLWADLIDDLIFLVIPRPNELMQAFHRTNVVMADEQISIIHNCLKDLIVLFHRGGSGVATPTLEERANPLKHLLNASGMDTTPLIDLYNQRKTMAGSKTNNISTVTKEHVVAILGCRVDFDKEARTFVNKINGVVEKPIDPEVEQIKVIPETEFIIERYHCSLNGQLGVLILSSRYLGFHNLLKEIGVKLGTKVSVPLVNIEEIKKTKIAFLFNAMQVNTKDGKSYTFTGFYDRDSVFRDLSYQMKVAQKKQNNK